MTGINPLTIKKRRMQLPILINPSKENVNSNGDRPDFSSPTNKKSPLPYDESQPSPSFFCKTLSSAALGAIKTARQMNEITEAAVAAAKEVKEAARVISANQSHKTIALKQAIIEGREAISKGITSSKTSLDEVSQVIGDRHRLLVVSGREAINSSTNSIQSWSKKKGFFNCNENEDILPYCDDSDNAATYRTHEMLLDVHQDWLKEQAQKDVHSMLKRWNRLPQGLCKDIELRAGVLPAPAGEQRWLLEMANTPQEEFVGTAAQRRAAQERASLEVSIERKRRKTQLLKMLQNATTLHEARNVATRRVGGCRIHQSQVLAIKRRLHDLDDLVL